MGLIILAAFIAVPLIEIGLFIQVGGLIGLWPTLLIVFATAIAGTTMLRHQGLGALARLQESLDKGEAPIEPVFDGFCLLAAGLLLLTPGFFTDTIGFLLFIPPLRAGLRRLTAQRIQMRAQAHGGHASGASFHWQSGPGPNHPGGPAPSGPMGGGDVIDGEYTDVSDVNDPGDPHDKPKLSKTNP